jgi:hypothetical protein
MSTAGRFNISRTTIGKTISSNIGNELKQIRNSTTSPTLQRAVVYDVINDPFSLTEQQISFITSTVSNSELISSMPINSIIGKIVNDSQGQLNTDTLLLFPFYSHISLPIQPGETVYVIFENFQNFGNRLGFWLSRIHTQRSVEDLNYTHFDRTYNGSLLPDNYGTADTVELQSDSLAPSFPNGVESIPESSTIYTEPNQDAFDNIILNSLAYPLVTPEAVPRWSKRPQELVLHGSNNSLVMLGEDRNGSVYGASGSSPMDIKGHAGAIDLVVGRGRIQPASNENPGDGDSSLTSCRVILNTRQKLENDKAPFTRSQRNTENVNEGNPDPIGDAARIYIAQQSLVDQNYKLIPTNDGGLEYPTGALANEQPQAIDEQLNRSYVVAKADHIRIIARRKPQIGNGTIKIPGTILIAREGNKNTITPTDNENPDEAPDGDLAYIYFDKDGKIQIEGNRIYLGQGTGEAQPFVRYAAYEKTITILQDQIDKLRTDLSELQDILTRNFTSAVDSLGVPITALINASAEIKAPDVTQDPQIDKAKSKKVFGE